VSPTLKMIMRTEPPEYFYNGQRFYFNKAYKLIPEHQVKLMGKRVAGVERYKRKAAVMTGIVRGAAKHWAALVYFVEDSQSGRLCQMERPQVIE